MPTKRKSQLKTAVASRFDYLGPQPDRAKQSHPLSNPTQAASRINPPSKAMLIAAVSNHNKARGPLTDKDSNGMSMLSESAHAGTGEQSPESYDDEEEEDAETSDNFDDSEAESESEAEESQASDDDDSDLESGSNSADSSESDSEQADEPGVAFAKTVKTQRQSPKLVGEKVIYFRMFSTMTPGKAHRLKAFLRADYPDAKVILDVHPTKSCAFQQRIGLNRLLQMIMKKEIEHVLVANSTQICNTKEAFQLFEWISSLSNVEVHVVPSLELP